MAVIKRNSLKVGLAVGYGTGSELAVVFEKILKHLAHRYSINVEVLRHYELFHTSFSLDPENADPRYVQRATDKEVQVYEDFCQRLVARGSRVMFRTAINAQSLYLIRQHQEAVKVECFSKGKHSLLFVRDQAQDFCSGGNDHDIETDTVSKRSTFNKAMTGRIVDWSIQRARQQWGHDSINSVVMVYKFHMFDGIVSTWAKEWSQKHGIKIQFVQPDTVNRNLLAYGLKGRQLMIAGNEWADSTYAILLNTFGHGAQEMRCTENVYLRSDLQGLVEYQTVHGSADDIGGKGIVNPCATIRAAARILNDHGSAIGLEDRMNAVLDDLISRNATTRDQGGQLDTEQVLNLVLDAFPDRTVSDVRIVTNMKGIYTADGLTKTPLSMLVEETEVDAEV